MLLLLTQIAFAEDVVSGGDVPALNAQTFTPSLDSHHFFRVVDADLPTLSLSGNALLSYATPAVQYTDATGAEQTIVGSLAQLDLMGSYRLGNLRIGVDLPVLLRSFGGEAPDATGLGDITVDAKLRVLDPQVAAIGLAVTARAHIPVSTVGPGLAAPRAGADLLLGGSQTLGERLTLGADVGASIKPAVALENTHWGSQFVFDAGAAYALGARAGLVGELHGALTFADLGGANSTPLELLLGGYVRGGARQQVLFRPAVVLGLTDAVGTPTARVLLSVGYDPLSAGAPKVVDADGDGYSDSIDACPTQAEDKDGWEDQDGCPEPTQVKIVVNDSDGLPVSDATWIEGGGAGGATGASGDEVKLEAGSHTFTSGATSKAADIAAGPPTTVSLIVPAPRGELQVVVKDKAGKAVPGATWSAKGPEKTFSGEAGAKVPVRPGAYELSAVAAGYRDGRGTVTIVKDGTATLTLELLPSKAQLTAAKIEIKESIYFETGKAIIKAESLPLLDEVAEILNAHPELSQIRIEGNTDSRGNDAANLKLSQGRAAAVCDYLSSKGVPAARLTAVGYGETHPLVKETDDASRSKNRRVDFVVVERSDNDVNAEIQKIDVKDDATKPDAAPKGQ